MASEPDVSEISSMFERLARNRDISLFLPFILGLANDNDSTRTDSQDPDEESESTETESAPTASRERIILINPLTQGMVVIEGSSNLETLLREFSGKDGQPPASKESIEAIPTVEIGKDEDGECAICLDEWEVGSMAKEMVCKHKFHANCIDKWLGIHGSCPVCRYKIPADEKEMGKKRDEEGGERRRVERGIWVGFTFNGGRSDGDSSEAHSSDSNDSPSNPAADIEN